MSMKVRMWSWFVALAVVAALFLGACGGAAPEPGATPTVAVDSPLPTATAVNGSDGAGEDGVTIVDALDREVRLETLPQRLVAAGQSTLTTVNTLFLFPQAAERVVGLTVGQQKPGEFLGLVDAAFGQKAELEPQAGPEQIAPLQPDAVVIRSFAMDKLGTPLEQAGMAVVTLALETPEQFFRDLSTLGQLFGDEARAAAIRDYYQGRLDYVNEKLAGLEPAARPRVLLVQHSEQGGEVALEVPSAAWLQTMEVELAGGQPVWTEAAQAGGWTVVSLEQIAAWDPDQIYVVSYGANSAEIADQLEANPQWQALRAVQAGEVYGFAGDFYSWDQPDPRWILGVTWLASKIHPDLFTDLDMTAEVTSFYTEMYGLDETTVREQILPRLRGDVE